MNFIITNKPEGFLNCKCVQPSLTWRSGEPRCYRCHKNLSEHPDYQWQIKERIKRRDRAALKPTWFDWVMIGMLHIIMISFMVTVLAVLSHWLLKLPTVFLYVGFVPLISVACFGVLAIIHSRLQRRK